MKHLFLICICGLLYISCNTLVKKNTIENAQITVAKAVVPYFDYDEIIYYYNDISDSAVEILLDAQLKSQMDSIKYHVVLGSAPKDMYSLDILQTLESIGYKRTIISESKFPEISAIFSEKEVKDAVATKCLDIFRDILVF